ncbi:MAG: hypothetical protein PF569_00115 [Candidatus Woesearchaeota archaeon]|jgi:hypothetical protein|nr:hypothetical protein [Candidatus Woesearchaeota archaeon]
MKDNSGYEKYLNQLNETVNSISLSDNQSNLIVLKKYGYYDIDSEFTNLLLKNWDLLSKFIKEIKNPKDVFDILIKISPIITSKNLKFYLETIKKFDLKSNSGYSQIFEKIASLTPILNQNNFEMIIFSVFKNPYNFDVKIIPIIEKNIEFYKNDIFLERFLILIDKSIHEGNFDEIFDRLLYSSSNMDIVKEMISQENSFNHLIRIILAYKKINEKIFEGNFFFMNEFEHFYSYYKIYGDYIVQIFINTISTNDSTIIEIFRFIEKYKQLFSKESYDIILESSKSKENLNIVLEQYDKKLNKLLNKNKNDFNTYLKIISNIDTYQQSFIEIICNRMRSYLIRPLDFDDLQSYYLFLKIILEGGEVNNSLTVINLINEVNGSVKFNSSILIKNLDKLTILSRRLSENKLFFDNLTKGQYTMRGMNIESVDFIIKIISENEDCSEKLVSIMLSTDLYFQYVFNEIIYPTYIEKEYSFEHVFNFIINLLNKLKDKSLLKYLGLHHLDDEIEKLDFSALISRLYEIKDDTRYHSVQGLDDLDYACIHITNAFGGGAALNSGEIRRIDAFNNIITNLIYQGDTKSEKYQLSLSTIRENFPIRIANTKRSGIDGSVGVIFDSGYIYEAYIQDSATKNIDNDSEDGLAYRTSNI